MVAGIAQVAALVDELELSAARGDLVTVLAVRDRLDAQIALAVGELDATGSYEDDGDLSAVTWLVHHGCRDRATARRLVRNGRRLRAWPLLADAVLAGRIAGGQLEIIVANVGRHVEVFAEHEAELVPVLEPLTVEETARAMQDWRTRADALDDGPEPADRADTVHLSQALDGRGELRASLGSDLHAVVAAALRVADSGDLGASPAERRADALGTVCRHFLDHQRTRRAGRHRPHVNVVLTHDELVRGVGGTYLDTGGPVTPVELGVLACDSVLHRLLVGSGSAILDYGRATRTWPADLYNAIAARDQGCRWAGCDRPTDWCDVHHAHDWHHGGPTAIDNGVMLCRRHHRKLHHDWRAKLLPDGTLELTDPHGRTQTTEPRGPTPRRLWPDGG